MPDEIHNELLRLIALNNAERWLPEHIAFEQLLDRHGDRLIPGLGQMGIELIEVTTRTVSAIANPEIKITRWVALLPAAEKKGGDATPPALLVLQVSEQEQEILRS